MRFLKNTCTDPYFNMAFDEYCLEHLSLEEPVFYLWQNRPSVIMGANQEVNTEVNLAYLKEHDIALVRRVTGGGTVYHDFGNLNYTIVGETKNLEHDYPQYTHCILKALQSLGIPATLSGRNDILVENKKVSGLAKRVYKDRLMVHGTLMFDVDLEVLTQVLCPPLTKLQSKGIASVRSRVANLKEILPHGTDISSFKNQLEEILSNHYTDKEVIMEEKEVAQIKLLAEQKFAQWEWIYGRSPKATLTHSAHMACGTVNIHLSVEKNRIVSCHFGGDFLGYLPTSALEERLKGIPYDAESIQKCLSSFHINLYFDGMTVVELVGLMMQSV